MSELDKLRAEYERCIGAIHQAWEEGRLSVVAFKRAIRALDHWWRGVNQQRVRGMRP